MRMLCSTNEQFADAISYRAKSSTHFPSRHCSASGSGRLRQGKLACSITSVEVSAVLCPWLADDMKQSALTLCLSFPHC